MPLEVLSEKVQPSVRELYKKAKEESEAQTGNQFIELLLEQFLNPKVRTVEVVKNTPETDQLIQQLQNEIGRLKIEIDFKNQTIEAHEETLKQLGEKVSSIVEPVPTVPQLSEDQIIVTIPPIQKVILELEATAAAKKGKTFSNSDILLNCFWQTVKNGRYNLYRIWSESEIAREILKLKEANAQKQPAE